MSELFRDLRYSLRSMAQRPGFTLVATLVLALGIGANTAIFSLIHSILLQPLPYAGAERVVELWNRWEGSAQSHVAVPEFRAYRDETTSLAAVAAYSPRAVNLTGAGKEPERVNGVLASAAIFDVLGVEAARGRLLGAAEDAPGAELAAVISHELWQRRFGGDPDVVGSRIELNGFACTVLGILPPGTRMPRDFRQSTATDVWLPLQLDPADPGDWGMHWMQVVARLEESVDLATAQAELNLVAERLKAEHANSDDAVGYPSFGATLYPVLDQVVGPLRPALWLLLGAVGLVLLIACANVANLQLVRGELRRREIALRATLGAARSRLLRQLLTESLVLSVLGGVAGCLLGAWGLQLFIAFTPPGIPRLEEVRLDSTVLLFTFGLAVVTGLLFGLLPALQVSRSDLVVWLKSGEQSGAGGLERHRLRSALVVAEVTLAMVLVIAAGLLIRSFWNLQRVDPGYVVEDVLTLRLDVPQGAYPEPVQVADFFARLRQRLLSLPEVEAVGAVTHLPLAHRRGDWNFYYEERALRPGEPKPRGDWQVVTPGYFSALAIPILQGRAMEDRDDGAAPLVLVVNRTLAQKYWPEVGAVGRRIRLGGNDDNPFATIVGVVADIRHAGLIEEPVPELYIPQAQVDAVMGRGTARVLSVVLRTRGEPTRVLSSVRAELAALDPDLPIAQVRTLEEIRTTSLSLSRFAMALLISFAVLALLLGAVGIFGVISHVVAQRRREIGIRLALGAGEDRLLRMVVGHGMKLAAVGLGLGLALAFALTRFLSRLLYDVVPADPLTFATVAGSLALVCLGATYLPARRAARVDPCRTLREE